jgi:iron complex transport system substrate-binding protein
MTARAAVMAVVVFVCLGAVGPATASAATGPADGVATQEDCSFPVSETDATGTVVTLEGEPKRVVVLQPSDAQFVWEIGADDRVVGMPVTRYTDYLDGREGTTNVKNDDLTVNVERVVGQQPDLVLAANATPTATVEELRQTGLTVYHFELVESLDRIGTDVETVGRLLGECEAATERANRFRLDVRTVERAAERADERPSVLFHSFGFTAGPGTHIHDVLETAGGDNVAAAAGIDGYGELSEEVVVEQDPDWVVYPDEATLPSTAAYNGTTAVQEGQTVALDSNYLNQPGPRVVQPLTRLAKLWHPEELAWANESTTMANVTTPNGTTTESDDGTGGFGPGFGVVVAVVALLGASLLARNRT